jgi:hypothetical protein
VIARAAFFGRCLAQGDRGIALKWTELIDANLCSLTKSLSTALCSFPRVTCCCCYRLALDLAAQSGVTLPTTEAANNVYLAAMAQGHGDQDFSAVLTAYPTPAQAKEHGKGSGDSR